MTGKKELRSREQLLESCLAAFISAGSLDLSLDSLAKAVGSNKRMLIHYFGGRDNLEEMALSLLEDRLRARFRTGVFSPGTSLRSVLKSLWEQATHPEARGVLLLSMDLTRRGWSGSERGRGFFEEQQRLWTELLLEFQPDPRAVEALLQLFQGAVLVYLVTGDTDRGWRALERAVASETDPPA
ncbi:MAG: TetR/AcrR family transcriptional regulator [Thermoanaerobaculia bacterium]